MQNINSEDRKSAFDVTQVFRVESPDSHSFLLDPNFLNSFLPLEKKPFFFLPCAEQLVCCGVSAGREAGGEQQASAAAGPGAESRFEVGLSSLG